MRERQIIVLGMVGILVLGAGPTAADVSPGGTPEPILLSAADTGAETPEADKPKADKPKASKEGTSKSTARGSRKKTATPKAPADGEKGAYVLATVDEAEPKDVREVIEGMHQRRKQPKRRA